MKRLPLWPSSADKWLVCSGQPRISSIAQGFGKDDDKYTGEGKLAHEYLHWLLDINARLPDDADRLPVDQKAIVGDVADEIKEYAELGGLNILSEQHCELTFGQHKMNLYIDIVLYNDDRLIILDYKHGEGKIVSPHGNPQLMLYMYAVYMALAPHDIMEVGIIQPRGQGEAWTQIPVTDHQLRDFCTDVSTAVTAAYSNEVEYVKGPHCQFCPGTKNPICPAQLHAAIDAVCLDEEDPDRTTSWWLLDHVEGLRKVASGVDKAANVWLKRGRAIPGWCLEESDGRRRWIEPEEVPAVLAELLGGEEGDYKQNKKVPPITITEATKLAREKGVNINNLIHKPKTMKRVKGESIDNIAMEAIE